MYDIEMLLFISPYLPIHLETKYVIPPNMSTSSVEVSKLAELNNSAGGYDWAWQKNARALQEKEEGARGIEPEDGTGDIKASLNLSMDNTLMVIHVSGTLSI